MNDNHPIDPALQSLEGRVFALRPDLPDSEAYDLLFQCGFAAGQKAAAKRTRRWQVVSAALMVSASIFVVRGLGSLAHVEPATLETANSPQTHTPESIESSVAKVAAVPLDAWQIRADTSATLETALTRFNRRDSDSRSLAVGAMTRAVGAAP